MICIPTGCGTISRRQYLNAVLDRNSSRLGIIGIVPPSPQKADLLRGGSIGACRHAVANKSELVRHDVAGVGWGGISVWQTWSLFVCTRFTCGDNARGYLRVFRYIRRLIFGAILHDKPSKRYIWCQLNMITNFSVEALRNNPRIWS